jgi:phosphate transport system permease protein
VIEASKTGLEVVPSTVSKAPANGIADGQPLPNSVYRRRLWVHRIGISLSFAAMAIGIFFLLWILATLVVKGLGAVHVGMFTLNTPPPGDSGGGLLNAIVGSLMMVGFATLLSTPIGILAGIYLAEYGEQSRFAQITRFVTDIMLSAPSIVIGLFVYALYVAYAKHFSGWAGSLAIALIAIPIVVRTTDNMLNLVPTSLREAAYALGAPRWKVAMFVRVRAVRAGVITGLLLALARIAGETAPLLFTALNNQFFSVNMNAPMANLPVVIYQFAMSPYENWRSLAWGGALLITFSVLGLNILSRTLFNQKIQS